MKKRFILFVTMVFIPFLNVKAETIANHVKDISKMDTITLAFDDPDNNVRYIGPNPDNYVLFNNELWRIVGVFNGRVKLVRAESLGKYAWDSSEASINYGYGINEWNQADLMYELNGDYLNYNLDEDTLWYDGKNNQKNGVFDHTKVLSKEAQNLIDDNVWYLGNPRNDNGTIVLLAYGTNASEAYFRERNYVNKFGDKKYGNDTVKRQLTWTGKVGLLNYSDFAYSTADYTNGNKRTKCLLATYVDFHSQCIENSYLYSADKTYFLLSPNSHERFSSAITTAGKYDSYGYVNNDIKPAVYLKESVLVVGGNGTSTDPYQLAPSNTVKFDTNSNIKVDTQYVGKNFKAEMPENINRENYKFLGWYSDSELTNKYDFDTPVTDDLTLYAKWKYNYKITSGANQTYLNEAITIKTNGDLDKLTEIKINGKILDKAYYSLENGSTVLTLNNSYLNTLDSGTYEILFVYNDGSVGTTFKTIEKSKSLSKKNNSEITDEVNKSDNLDKINNPYTGDNIMFYILMFGLSIICLIGAGICVNKKKNSFK